jgi:hypothetical protein
MVQQVLMKQVVQQELMRSHQAHLELLMSKLRQALPQPLPLQAQQECP